MLANCWAAQASRQQADILEAPVHKPLDSLADFRPLKSCSEYILQDCVEALPGFLQYAETLVRESRLVASSILDTGLDKGLDPSRLFALVRTADGVARTN